MQLSDSALATRAQAGDKTAFGELIARHRPMALWLAARLLGEAAEAEDATQEACLQAYLGLQRLRQPERFAAWLYGIVVNLCRMRLRTRRACYSLEDWDGGRVARGFTWAEAQPSAEATSEMRELHRAVMAAVALLPSAQQAVVRLHYLDGLTLTEIGVLAAAPLGTVKARLHRARARLRAVLLSQGVGEGRLHSPRKKEAIMIEMIVKDVVARMPKGVDRPLVLKARLPLPQGAGLPPGLHRVVLLKERHGDRLLPIWIGPHEADAIVLQLAEKSPLRPLTHDLAVRLLEAAGVTVERASITRLHDEVFYATVTLGLADGERRELDARPSDALNLALRAKAPIYADEQVLAAVGVMPDELHAKLDESRAKVCDEPGLVPAEAEAMEWRSVPPPEFILQPAPGRSK